MPTAEAVASVLEHLQAHDASGKKATLTDEQRDILQKHARDFPSGLLERTLPIEGGNVVLLTTTPGSAAAPTFSGVVCQVNKKGKLDTFGGKIEESDGGSAAALISRELGEELKGTGITEADVTRDAVVRAAVVGASGVIVTAVMALSPQVASQLAIGEPDKTEDLVVVPLDEIVAKTEGALSADNLKAFMDEKRFTATSLLKKQENGEPATSSVPARFFVGAVFEKAIMELKACGKM